VPFASMVHNKKNCTSIESPNDAKYIFDSINRTLMMEEHCASIVSILVINAKHDIDKINVTFAQKICTFEYCTHI